jgi:CDP-glucose 4,6-dehydratase
MLDMEFYHGKKVLVTGHTGFKGSWMCRMLINLGAEVTGYSLNPPTDPNLFNLCDVKDKMNSVIGDIRDLNKLMSLFNEIKPEIVIHLAAQPIVRHSYMNPVYTYETNVMGTVNVLECLRHNKCVKSMLNITTDKVYQNNEWEWGYRENEPLVGDDPYSNSKSCSELITHSYKNSFFQDGHVAISTVRAGNVIGGGDFADYRIIPDCIRAAANKKEIIVRNPDSIRPYQHVLEALYIYLTIAQKQYENIKFAGSYNVGPDDIDCITTSTLVDMFCNIWGGGMTWAYKFEEGPHEAKYIKLDCSKIKEMFEWKSHWHIDEAVEKTVEWAKVYYMNGNIPDCMDNQIRDFLLVSSKYQY